MKLSFLTALIVLSLSVQGQSVIDSLEQLLNVSADTTRIDVLTQLGYRLFYNDQLKAAQYARLAIQESEALNYPKGKASGLYIKGIIHDINHVTDSSEYYFKQGYELSKQNGLMFLEGNGLNNLGMMNWNMGQYNTALNYFLEALRVYEADHNEKGISKAVSNIGLIYQELNQFQMALVYNFRSLKMRLNHDNDDHIARSYNNIGICMRNIGYPDSSIFYIEKGIEYATAANSNQVLGSLYDNMGNAYNDLKEIDKAIDTHMKSLTFKSNGAFELVASYTNLSSLFLKTNQSRNALTYALKADSIMKANNIPNVSVDNYFNLANAYLSLGKKDSAIAYYEKWRMINNSLHGEESAKAVAEMQTKYETEKKEQQLAFLEEESALKDKELYQSKIIIIMVVILALVVILGLMAYNSRRRYKLRAQLAEEKELLQKTRFKAVIDAEEKERKRIAQELHDGLGQLLSTARITISGVGEADDKKVKNALMLVDQSIDEVRSISHNLMPNALIAVGLKSALMGLVRKINESDQVKVSLNIAGELSFDESKTISIYRIIQEVINNALKYSQSSTIDIKIDSTVDDTVFSIVDKGTGFDTSLISESKGIGWSNIFSRVDLIGGLINIYSKLESGTTVKITVPNGGTIDQAAIG